VSRRIVIAYWLIPAEPARSFFEGVINDLARRYHAPPFEPHVTIHVGANRADAAKIALLKAARECKRVKLEAIGLGSSAKFIKTLFVEFAANKKLHLINQTIRTAAQDSLHYVLKPHLSLLYKQMRVATRRELADSIHLRFSGVTFDALKAVRCISPTQSRADVEAWRVIATQKLFR
jgi:2'-5' RNA ligase